MQATQTARLYSLRRPQLLKPCEQLSINHFGNVLEKNNNIVKCTFATVAYSCNRSFYAWQHGTRSLKQHDLTRWDKASVDTLPPQDTSTGMAAKYTLALISRATFDSNSCSLDLEVPR